MRLFRKFADRVRHDIKMGAVTSHLYRYSGQLDCGVAFFMPAKYLGGRTADSVVLAFHWAIPMTEKDCVEALEVMSRRDHTADAEKRAIGFEAALFHIQNRKKQSGIPLDTQDVTEELFAKHAPRPKGLVAA